MPEHVLLFRVFVGAPSDVDEAHDVIRGQIEQWNRDHGPLSRARVEFTNWRTHSHPAAGGRPQAILNKQVVDQCDIMVGIFNSRFAHGRCRFRNRGGNSSQHPARQESDGVFR